jgi:hypothetical protein
LEVLPITYKFDTRRVSITPVFDERPKILAVPVTFRVGNDPVVKVVIFAVVIFARPAVSTAVVRVPTTVASINETAVVSNASLPILSYTYAEFFKESAISC